MATQFYWLIFDLKFVIVISEIKVSISLRIAALPTAVALVEKLGAAAIVRFRNSGWLCRWLNNFIDLVFFWKLSSAFHWGMQPCQPL
ncbi:hypothetical protein [Pedobacter jejuensis]|uniref:Uncharacterized protein n=1 Tax=Pedobacter jejuensis TaxID=1268550 RepID=A0A3N0BXT2_9SPHI|nr:hypothetical protein [Pedobacter jejuensis]RNL54558.1 hypothetical protein D7004_07145 [Pedobacter jejuensis]